MADEPLGPLDHLKRTVRAFQGAGLPFMVVGAFAVMAHAVPRTTADLDLVVHLPFDERYTVRPVLEELSLTGEVEERRDPEWGNRLTTPLSSIMDLEVFFTPPRPLYDREFDRRVQVQDVSVPMLSPEDLILRTLVNTRLRTSIDLGDAIAVAKTTAEDLDLDYLRTHCGPHRVCGLLRDVLTEAGLS